VRANSLLRQALTLNPETVLDVGGAGSDHAIAFISNGAKDLSIDPRHTDLTHKNYQHEQSPYEEVDLEDKFDVVWCSHVLEHIPNVQHFLVTLYGWLKDDGYLCIAVPPDRQRRLHVGHLTLWTPAHLAYNLVCAGYDCKDAIWYTEYLSIGMMVQKKPCIDLSWRTGLPNELSNLNLYMPKVIRHEDGAWWGNNWPEELEAYRASDPPCVTIGASKTNLPPDIQLAFGPNPELRDKYKREEWHETRD